MNLYLNLYRIVVHNIIRTRVEEGEWDTCNQRFMNKYIRNL